MNYQKITKFDTANGPGIRTVLWVSGCNHHCIGCHNPTTWNPDSGYHFNTDAFHEILESLKPSYIRGLTLSGGDPLYPSNRFDILHLVKAVKMFYPDKDIWMWTGYLYEDVKDLMIMKYIDVLVDGPFILEQRDITHPYHGSPNQRVIDMKLTRESGNIILYTE